MDIGSYRTAVESILEDLRVKVAATNEYAAHYTNALTPKIMLATITTNRMRQYDGDYMNDPEEGRYLVDVMIAAAQECKHERKSAFVERLTELRESRLLYTAYKKASFLSCWTMVQIKPGDEHGKDSLNHWRFYGDDGRGASLMIPLSNLLTIFPNQLFKVIYGTEMRGGGSSASQRPIQQLKTALVSRLSNLKKTPDRAMVELEEVIQATHPLLFLFKSSEYAAEREVRSICHKDSYGSASGVSFDDRGPDKPRRAYVEGAPGLICDDSLLYYGPKSDPMRAIEAMGHAADLGIGLQVFVSSMPYR